MMLLKKEPLVVQVQAVVMLIILLAVAPTLGCPPNGKSCKDCIVDQMKHGCPPCMPILHCMARCLWGGTSRTNCVKKCDCNDGYPTLSDCKRCMSKCKCSCIN